jgi:hypothetical protein
MRGLRGSSAAGAAMALVAVAWLLFAATASGETLEVTSDVTDAPGSLGSTILEAGEGDTIKVPAGEYVLTNGDTLLEQGNVIQGAGEGLTTIVPSGGGEALGPTNVVDASVAEPLNSGAADDDEGPKIETKAQILALIGTLAIFVLILELVRRRRLVERYALLWMSAAIALLVLAIWTDGLEVISDLMGVSEPANAIFILAFGVAFLLLLNFSVATSRLSEETKILAQETARLEQELREVRGEVPSGNGASAEAEAATPAREPERSEPPAGT